MSRCVKPLGLQSDEKQRIMTLPIRENYQIRPAPAIFACPGTYMEKSKIWELLDVERHAGMRLWNLMLCGGAHRNIRLVFQSSAEPLFCGGSDPERSD